MRTSIAANVTELDRARIARLWTWGELGRRASVSGSTISDLRRTGRCTPTTLEKIRTALGMSRERATA